MPKYTIAISEDVAHKARIAGSILGNPNLSRFIALAVEKYAEQVIEGFKTPSTPMQQCQTPCAHDRPSPFDNLQEPHMLGTVATTQPPAYFADVRLVPGDWAKRTRAIASEPNARAGEMTARAACRGPTAEVLSILRAEGKPLTFDEILHKMEGAPVRCEVSVSLMDLSEQGLVRDIPFTNEETAAAFKARETGVAMPEIRVEAVPLRDLLG